MDHITIAERWLRIEEGFRRNVYRDTGGNPTVGYGILLPKDSTYKVGERVPLDVLDAWFRERFLTACRDAEKYTGKDAWDALNAPRKAMIISMAYQHGYPKLSRFTAMKAALRKQNWNRAAREMLDSLTAKKTPGRMARQAEVMRTGEIPKEVLQ